MQKKHEKKNIEQKEKYAAVMSSFGYALCLFK